MLISMSSENRLQDQCPGTADPARLHSPPAQSVSGHKGRDQWMCALAAASNLSTMAIRLVLRLCVSFNCKTGQCDPGYRTLAADMAVSERSVFRAIAELEAGGWIAVDRTGGDNTRNNQFALLIPSAQVTTVVTRSGDNMVSPEKVSVQVTENAGSGDKNSGVQVTHSVSPLKNLKPENLNSAALHAARTSRADRESVSSNSADTADDENQRASEEALIETVAAQQQPPTSASENMGRPAANGRAAPAASPFAQVLSVYPKDRVGDEAKAFFVFARALDALGDVDDVVDAIITLKLERGADVPDLADALAIVIKRSSTGRQ
jgi:hypothetical protein